MLSPPSTTARSRYSAELGQEGLAEQSRARVWPEKLEEEFFDGREEACCGPRARDLEAAEGEGVD